MAAELLAQAEHAPGSCLLVTAGADLASAVQQQVKAQLVRLSREQLTRKALEFAKHLLVTPSHEEASNSWISSPRSICRSPPAPPSLTPAPSSTPAPSHRPLHPCGRRRLSCGPIARPADLWRRGNSFPACLRTAFAAHTSLVEFDTEGPGSTGPDDCRLWALAEGFDAHAEERRAYRCCTLRVAGRADGGRSGLSSASDLAGPSQSTEVPSTVRRRRRWRHRARGWGVPRGISWPRPDHAYMPGSVPQSILMEGGAVEQSAGKKGHAWAMQVTTRFCQGKEGGGRRRPNVSRHAQEGMAITGRAMLRQEILREVAALHTGPKRRKAHVAASQSPLHVPRSIAERGGTWTGPQRETRPGGAAPSAAEASHGSVPLLSAGAPWRELQQRS